jgi:hypothetical protein
MPIAIERKQVPTHLEDVATTSQLVMLGGTEDQFVDASMIEKASCAHEVKTALDGKTVLIPRPSDDPADPLNWSQLRKCLVLLVISCTAFLPDYGSGTGAVTLIPQAKEWGLSEDTVNHHRWAASLCSAPGASSLRLLPHISADYRHSFGSWSWHCERLHGEQGHKHLISLWPREFYTGSFLLSPKAVV